MFRNELERRMKTIFGLGKTTFDAPSDQFEQDTLFIQVDRVLPSIKDGREVAAVYGVITVYSQKNKMPFGYFDKRIANAKNVDKKGLHFYDFEEDVANSPSRIINIGERKRSFLFLYDAQYDPNQGELTSVEFTT